MLVSKAIADKLKTNTLYNTITLHSPDGSFEDITGESIVLDSFSLEQEITEKELKFGGCIASEMSVKLIDYDCSALIGKTVQVIITATYLEPELYPSDDLYPSKTLILPAETGTVECPIFYGKIQSAQRDKKQRNTVKITAYDAFYDMSKVDMSLWFAGKENEDGSFAYGFAHYAKGKTFQNLYKSLYDKWEDYGVKGVSYPPYLDISSLPLNFDDDCVEKVIKDITLTDLIQAYMELTLSFAMIEPKNGNLEFLPLYGSKSADTVDSYKDLSFEDYELAPIRMYSTKFANKKVYKKGNSNDYSWYISDNILMRCRTTAGDIAEKYNFKNLFGDNHKYRPTKIKLFSYWWLEAGDKYTVQTPFEDLPTIETFAFNKKMSGFTTTLTSKGEKRLGKEVKRMNKYNKIVFVNGSAPALNADNLNHMDEGIERATDGAIALETEIATARGGSADLNTRFTADEASLEAVKSEIATARGGQSSLGARLDTVDANLAKKADKSTTLAGYGITNAYTREETDKKLARKLDSMPFDSEPKNNSPCYLTSGTVYSALLVKADKTALATKYDSANIESGTSKLTPYSTNTDKIKNASCTYKTIGDIVIVSATVKMNAVTIGASSAYLLIDLPYKCISADDVFCVGISNLGKLFKFAIPKNNTWLQFQSQDKTAYTFADGEQINVICLYKIK